MDYNKFHIDLTSNSLHLPEIREQTEKHLKDSLIKAVPGIVDRQKELPPFMVVEYGSYSGLMTEARKCYEFGFFNAAVSILCVAAEKYAMELSGTKKGNQEKRLVLLEKNKIISSAHHNNLKKISRVRDKYLHPGKIEEADAKKDAFDAISLFTQVIQERFHEMYEIRNGIIHSRKTNQPFKIELP